MRIRVAAVLFLVGACCFGPGLAEARPGARPHIVVILADDLGWNDVGYHGSEIATPHIDRLAREGVELHRFYVQPTCSPTRSGLMTGKSPLRLGITRPISKNEPRGLSLEETILPQHLARLGYQPLMVGKWHLGHHTPDQFPQARGFEHFYGHVTGGIGYWDHNHGGGHDWQRNGETLREEGYATHLLADEAVRVLEARDRSRPTFLYLSFSAPHLPNEAPDAAIARHAAIDDPNRRVHAAMVDELDRAIGRVLGVLEAEDMLDDAIVLFASDNGGLVRAAAPEAMRTASDWILRVFDRPVPIEALEFLVSNVNDGGSDNRPLPTGKGNVGEGGARVPATIRWPARLEPSRFDGFMTISDVLPTLLDAIGASDAIPDDLDGASRWAALRGGGDTGALPDYVTTGYAGMAIYRWPWKLVDPESAAPRLHHLEDDPFEKRDVAADHPERVAALARAAAAWPRGPGPEVSMLGVLWDPDRFGGPEDRAPWADAARERAENP